MNTTSNTAMTRKDLVQEASDRTDLGLSYIHFTSSHSKKTRALLDFLAEKMEKECGFPPGRIFEQIAAAKTGFSKESQRKLGFVILHDGKTLYCASMLSFTSILTRWVPLKHRNKGYARIMLLAIEALVRTVEHSHMPLWIVSARKTEGINARAGWERNDTPNKDRQTGLTPEKEEDQQHDWFPPWSKDAYFAYLNISRDERAKLSPVFLRQWETFVEEHGGSTDLDLKAY